MATHDAGVSVGTIEVAPVLAAPPDIVAVARSPRLRRPPGWLLVSGLGLLLAALLVTAATVDADSGQDALGLLGSVLRDLARLRWQFAAIVVALGAAHYVAAAIAARAASGLSLPLGETLLVQLAAAAANRLTPAGIGGSALNVRYFARRGLDVPAGVGAVSALAVLGALADLLALTVLVAVGQALGLGGVSEIGVLAGHARHLLGPVRTPWLWVGVALVLAVAGTWWLVRGRRHEAAPGRFWAPVRRLVGRPRALTTVLASSGSTTLLLGIAFVACIQMVPGPPPNASLAAVLVAFMLGSAAGSSVPVPAGLGSTEGALVAVLLSLGEPAAHAVQVVMVFRLITFWTPAAVGILATRVLYRRSAL